MTPPSCLIGSIDRIWFLSVHPTGTLSTKRPTCFNVKERSNILLLGSRDIKKTLSLIRNLLVLIVCSTCEVSHYPNVLPLILSVFKFFISIPRDLLASPFSPLLYGLSAIVFSLLWSFIKLCIQPGKGFILTFSLWKCTQFPMWKRTSDSITLTSC